MLLRYATCEVLSYLWHGPRQYITFHDQRNIQAHAFKAGLELNGSDKSLQQAFWDSVSLMTQTKEAGQNSLETADEGMLQTGNLEATLLSFPAAAAAITEV